MESRMTHHTFNDFHAGDQIIHLHFLRALAKQNPERKFVHYMPECHIGQMTEVVEDLPTISLLPLEQKKDSAINAWKNANDFWVNHPSRWDWSEFHLRLFEHLAARIRVPNPFHQVTDLLFDYPALGDRPTDGTPFRYDFLVVNSRPCSGQLLCYDSVNYMDRLIERLSKVSKVLVTQECGCAADCTSDVGMSLTDIGAVSIECRHHIMVATGPMWPTLNTHNNHVRDGRTRIALLGNGERLNMPEITQIETVEQVIAFAEEQKWI